MNFHFLRSSPFTLHSALSKPQSHNRPTLCFWSFRNLWLRRFCLALVTRRSFFLWKSNKFLTFCLFSLSRMRKQARREREEQEKMKQDSIKSSQQQQQQHHKSQQQQQDHAAILSSQNSHGHPHSGHIGNHNVGGLVGSHLHHPSLVQNDLKLGLGGMGGGLGSMSMMQQLDNKNQDLLKAVSKVSS